MDVRWMYALFSYLYTYIMFIKIDLREISDDKDFRNFRA